MPIDHKNHEDKDLFQVAQSTSVTCLEILNHWFERQEEPSKRLQDEIQSKENKLEELHDNLAKLYENINAEKNSSEKIENLNVEIQKLQGERAKESRAADEVISEVVNAQKFQHEHKEALEIKAFSKLHSILEELKGKDINHIFNDLEFPPTLDSLCKHNDCTSNYRNAFSESKWSRPHEFLKTDYSNVKLFDGINPNDVNQGNVGDCYFCSSVSTIAEYPSRLQKIFNSKESNPYGVYSINIYKAGVLQEVIVDDKFLCYEWGNPRFLHGKGNEIWPNLLEKAWAKIFGNYCAIIGGAQTEVYRALLGFPVRLLYIKDITADKLWEQLSHWDKEKFIMGCSPILGLDQAKTGLVSNHGYSLLGVYRVGNYRLIKARNPWGHVRWTGDFSHNSLLWTEEAKRRVGISDTDDGIFCIKLEDFVLMFDHYTVCYYKDHYYKVEKEIESHRRHADYFEFEVHKASSISISVLQANNRFFKKSGDYKCSHVQMVLLKKESEDQYKYISNFYNLLNDYKKYTVL